MRIVCTKKHIIALKEIIMEGNYCIKCEVQKCRHNIEGKNCMLDSIKVTCGCDGSCTCCGNYCEND